MDIKAELKEAKQKAEEIVAEMKQIEIRRQQLLREALRVDGEIRVLKRLDGGKKDG